MWPAAEIQFQKVLLREEMGLEITILKLDIDGLVGGNLRKRLHGILVKIIEVLDYSLQFAYCLCFILWLKMIFTYILILRKI